MKNFLVVSALGLFFGFAMVQWIRPDTSAGAAFIVVATVIAFFLIGVAATFVWHLFRKSSSILGRAVNHDDIT